MSTDYETRDKINAKTQSSTNSARVRNNNPRQRLVGLLLLLLPPPEPAPITRRRSSFLPCPPLPFRCSLEFLLASCSLHTTRVILFSFFFFQFKLSKHARGDVVNLRVTKRKGKKKPKGMPRWGSSRVCVCVSSTCENERRFFFFFFCFQQTHLLVSLPARPMLPPPPLEGSHVPTQFPPRVGCFVSNEICNRKPATLGHAPRRKSTGTGSNVSYGGDPVNFFSLFFPHNFFVCLFVSTKTKWENLEKCVCVCVFFSCRLN